MKNYTVLASLALIAFCHIETLAAELPATPFPNAQHTHQAEDGTWELTPLTGLAFSHIASKVNDASIDEVASVSSVLGEYAFSQMFSLGFGFGYKSASGTVNNCPSGNVCHSPKSNGLTDPNLIGKFKTAAGPGTFKAILDLDVTLGDDTQDSSANSNAFSGQNTVNLGVAYELPVGPGLLGAKISYDIYKGDKTTKLDTGSSTSTVKTRGGADLEAEIYYEYKYKNTTFGGLVRYQNTPSTVSSIDGSDYTSDNSKSNLYGLGVYVPVVVGGDITLYPEFDYGHNSADSAGNIKDSDVYFISFNARFVF